MSTEAYQIINELSSCYQIGKERRYEHVRAKIKPDSEIEASNLQMLRSLLPRSEFILLAQMAKSNRTSLKKVGQGDFLSAANHIENGLQLAEKSNSKITISAIYSHGYALKSLLNYRQKEYEHAEKFMLNAIKATENLILLGFYQLETRRHHLEHNLVKVYSFSNQFELAIDRIFKNISYLAGSAKYGPYTDELNPVVTDHLTDADRQASCYPYLEAFAIIFAIVGAKRSQSLIQTAESYICQLESLKKAELFNTPLSWLHIKALYLNLHTDPTAYLDYLLNATRFMEDGDRGWPILWYALAKDVHTICRSIDSHHSNALCTQLEEDQRKTTLPRPLKIF